MKPSDELIAIPLNEYIALQRLLGCAQSITDEKYVTHYRDTPYDMERWHHPVPPQWRASLVHFAALCVRERG